MAQALNRSEELAGGVDYPALLAELKWDQSAEGAIRQIKEREYVKQ